MPANVIVGGQFGSEGKGKVTALVASRVDSPWVVRCGGPNSGHTTNVRGEEMVLRQLPAAAGQSDARLAIAAGCVVDESVLLREIDCCDIRRDRLTIDPRAVLVESIDYENERNLSSSIGSTGSGNGSAQVRRILRSDDVRLAKHSTELAKRATVETVAPRLHAALVRGEHVVVEGTQGFGLSLLHGPGYPYLTSKDTTAAAFAMEAGLSPRDIDDVTLVIRTYPIRVGGNSGEFPNEIGWDVVQHESGAPSDELEFTSVTKRVRRVAKFDLELVRSACKYNRPTNLAVMGLDRLNHLNRNAENWESLSENAKAFLRLLRSELEVPISWCGTGFATFDAFNILTARTVVTNA